MFQWFYNLKIKSKLIGSFGFVIALTVLLGTSSWLGEAHVQNTVHRFLKVENKIAKLSSDSEVAMLTARRKEKDFLLRYKTEGFDKAKEAYVVELQKDVASIHQNMADIRALKPDDAELVAATTAIDEAITKYETTFLQTVDILEMRGYANAGLEGELSRKIGQVYGVVKSMGDDKLLIDVLIMQQNESEYLYSRDEKFINYLDNANKKFAADVNKTEMYDSDKRGLVTLSNQYEDALNSLVQADAEVVANTEEFRNAVQKLEPLLDQITAVAEQQEARTEAEVNKAIQLARTIILSIGLVVVVVGAAVAIGLAQIIAGAVKTVAQAAQGIAAGNLNQQVSVNSKDELGEMASAFTRMLAYLKNMAFVANQLAVGDLTVTVTPQSADDELGNAFVQMIANLQQMVGRVVEGAATLSQSAQQLNTVAGDAGAAAQQVAQTIQEVAAGTTQQTESVAQANNTVQQVAQAVDGVAQGAQEQARAVSESMDRVTQIASAVDRVTEGAQHGALQATEAARVAQAGAETVAATVDGMEAIKHKVNLSAQRVQEMGDRSQQIGAIVETIDDIAAQTNLLALNAAIEAARAGEHGKGFAVVADEVRKLAEKSAAATREIADLIKTIQHTVTDAVTAMEDGRREVEAGVVRASESGQALTDILHTVENVQQQVSQISAAAQEMSASSEDLVRAMESVSAVVEENTASTEEMAAGSAEVTEVINTIASVSQQNGAAVQEVNAAAEEMSAQVEQVADSARTLNELARDLTLTVAEFKFSAEQTDLAQQLELFRQAHLHWIDRLQEMLRGRITLDENTLEDHTECALGKWYSGPAADPYRHMSEFQALENTHLEFHKLCYNTALNHNQGDAEVAAAELSRATEASHKIVALLNTLETRIATA